MTDQTSDEQTVRLLVEQLITAAGTHDLDTFEGLMAAHANVGWASFRDGAWTTTTMTADSGQPSRAPDTVRHRRPFVSGAPNLA